MSIFNFSDALNLMKQGEKLTIFELNYPFYFSFTKGDHWNKPAFWSHHIYTGEKAEKIDFHYNEVMSENWIIYTGDRKY